MIAYASFVCSICNGLVEPGQTIGLVPLADDEWGHGLCCDRILQAVRQTKENPPRPNPKWRPRVIQGGLARRS